MKLLSPVTESTTHVIRIDSLPKIHVVLWKQILQRPCCICVWCGMIDEMSFGPVILEDRVTGENYLDVLQNELPKQLEDVPLATRIATYFHRDGVLSHYIRLVMQRLNYNFPNWWIDSSSTTNWPPRSPDVTPLDFCLWAWMKSEVCRRKVIHETNCSII
jgi:hypothetical protein